MTAACGDAKLMPFEWMAPRNALSIASACAEAPVATGSPSDAAARTGPTDCDRANLRVRTCLVVMAGTSLVQCRPEGRYEVVLPDIQRRYTRLIGIASARTLRIPMVATSPKPAGHRGPRLQSP